MSSKHGILVGVTGRGENTAALRWAAQEATRRGVPVTLAHVVHEILPPPPPSVLMAPIGWDDIGRYVLDQVEDELTTSVDASVPVQRVLEHGYPSWTLCELSHDADLVVVQHRGRHGLHRLSTRSAAVTLGGHAACPAVSVPEGWTGEQPQEDADWITVGVHEKGASPEVLAAAFAAASARGASLRLVHAWRLDPAYDAIVVARIDPSWGERVRAEITEAADAEMQAHPTVKVDVQVLHQWPAEALDQLAETSSLLVVGRHETTMPWPRIGSIARAAISRSACPVMVVPT